MAELTVRYPREIAVPFRFDAGGGVAATPVRAEQIAAQIRSAVATGLGERVMRPSYGSAARESVFDTDDGVALARLTDTVRSAVRRHVPVASVEAISGPAVNDDGLLEVEVRFTLPEGGPAYIATIPIGGPVTEEAR